MAVRAVRTPCTILLGGLPTEARLTPHPCPACCPGHILVHPFRARGKNSELLLVSDDEDMATWQRRALSLHWATGALKGQSASEANHTR